VSLLPSLLLAQICTCAKQLPSPILEVVIDLLIASPAKYCNFERKFYLIVAKLYFNSKI
jgi:hypothetical protein